MLWPCHAEIEDRAGLLILAAFKSISCSLCFRGFFLNLGLLLLFFILNDVNYLRLKTRESRSIEQKPWRQAPKTATYKNPENSKPARDSNPHSSICGKQRKQTCSPLRHLPPLSRCTPHPAKFPAWNSAGSNVGRTTLRNGDRKEKRQ